MRVRTKLFLTFVPLVGLCSVAVMEATEHLGEVFLYQQYQAKALSIAATAAVAIPPELHAKLQTPSDENSEAYRTLAAKLRQIRDANRRDDTWVRYLYTITPSQEKAGVFRYGVDPEEDVENHSALGEIVRGDTVGRLKLDQPTTFDSFVHDEFGTWLSAYYPLRNQTGETIALVGVDIDAARVIGAGAQLLHKSAVALFISILLAGVVALFVSRRVTRPLERLQQAMTEVGKGNFEVSAPITSRDEFGAAADALVQMTNGLRERERIKSAFARYVSHQVVDTLLAPGAEYLLAGDRRRITVLFCDIRGFTTMSERLRPEQVVMILNSYFERMVEVIFRHNGTLDKFIGDGLMAVFGAPKEDPLQEEHAVRAALEIRRELLAVSAQVKRDFGVDLAVGIGINSGPAIVGNIGSSKRMEYTAIGDTVNLASRLEAYTKEAGVDLIISEYTWVALNGAFPGMLRRIGSAQLKGKSEGVTVFTVDENVVDLHPLSAPTSGA